MQYKLNEINIDAVCQEADAFLKKKRNPKTNIIKFTNNDIPSRQSGSILKKVESVFFSPFL